MWVGGGMRVQAYLGQLHSGTSLTRVVVQDGTCNEYDSRKICAGEQIGRNVHGGSMQQSHTTSQQARGGVFREIYGLRSRLCNFHPLSNPNTAPPKPSMPTVRKFGHLAQSFSNSGYTHITLDPSLHVGRASYQAKIKHSSKALG